MRKTFEHIIINLFTRHNSAFLDGLADGTVGVHMMDKYFAGEDYPYQDSGFRHHQLTVEKGYPAAWIQFTHNGEAGKTLGNQYKDQFHLLFTGLGALPETFL